MPESTPQPRPLHDEPLRGQWNDFSTEEQEARYKAAWRIGYDAAERSVADGPIDFIEVAEDLFDLILFDMLAEKLLKCELADEDASYWNELMDAGTLKSDGRIFAIQSGWNTKMCQEQTTRWLAEPLPSHTRHKVVLYQGADGKRYFLVAESHRTVDFDAKDFQYESEHFAGDLADAAGDLRCTTGETIFLKYDGSWEVRKDPI
ncbi:MAG TPA: hypothetical protein V6C81_13540 [Planktothrix sp.]|jgi:hypothetical protein